MGSTRDDWLHFIWRVLKHPAFEATAVIALVLFAAWLLVDTPGLHRGLALPVFSR